MHCEFTEAERGGTRGTVRVYEVWPRSMLSTPSTEGLRGQRYDKSRQRKLMLRSPGASDSPNPYLTPFVFGGVQAFRWPVVDCVKSPFVDGWVSDVKFPGAPRRLCHVFQEASACLLRECRCCVCLFYVRLPPGMRNTRFAMKKAEWGHKFFVGTPFFAYIHLRNANKSTLPKKNHSFFFVFFI